MGLTLLKVLNQLLQRCKTISSTRRSKIERDFSVKMESQFHNAQPSYAHYPYYPPPSHPQNPNPPLIPTSLHPPGVDSYTALTSYQQHYHQTATHGHVASYYEAQASLNYGHLQSSSSQVDALPTANYYQDPSIAQSWAAKDSVRSYADSFLPHAGYATEENTLENSSTYPMDPNILISHPLVYDAIQRTPKKTKVSQSMCCEVCKIDCNSKDVLDHHMLGKKHKNNLLLQQQTHNIISPTIVSLHKDKREIKNRSSTRALGMQVSSKLSAGKNLETKRRKLLEGGAANDSVMMCYTCNVICNNQIVFNQHLSGKKHAIQAGTKPANTIVPANPIPNFLTNSVTQPPFKKAKKKGLKKAKIVQSAWCEICSIDCNSQDVLIKHRTGKKHKKKLEKLNGSKKATNTPASTSSQITNNLIIGPQENPSRNNLVIGPQGNTSSNNLIIGPQENPLSSNGNAVKSRKGKKKRASEPEEDVETKRQKVVSGGAAAEAVRVCAVCNVVCNSQMVFNCHLSGQKHAAMVKKQAEASGTTFPAAQVIDVV